MKLPVVFQILSILVEEEFKLIIPPEFTVNDKHSLKPVLPQSIVWPVKMITLSSRSGIPSPSPTPVSFHELDEFQSDVTPVLSKLD